MIDENAFQAIGKILLRKIQAAANDGTLAEAPFFFDIARAWAHLDGAEPVKAWLSAGIIASGDFMARVAIGLVTHGIGTEERRFTMQDSPEPTLYDLRVLRDAGTEHLKDEQFVGNERRIVAEIVRGSDRMLEGLSSEGTRDD